MKSFFIFLLFLTSLYSDNNFDKELPTLDSAVGTFQRAVETYASNVYLYQDDKAVYHVRYDKDFPMESENSFLQIYSSTTLDYTLDKYKRVKNKKNLYIKKFNSLYFLRLFNKDAKHTRKMFIELKDEFRDIYYTKASTRPADKPQDTIDTTKHKIVFLGDTRKQVKTDVLKDIVFSLSQDKKIPAIKSKKVYRDGNLDKIYDLKDYTSNFAIVRGDVLGVSNAGLYGFEPYTNYGLLCENTEDILYLVSKQEIKSIYDLRRKSISVGNISDIAQLYLKDIANESGVILDINFKSFSFEDSIKKVKNNELHSFFIFAPKDKIPEILKHGLYISSMPNDFLKVLNTKQGLNSVKYKIDDRLIRSYKVPNFLVAVVETLDTEMPKKIREVVEAFTCYKQASIPNAFYGNLHPELINIIAAIKADAEAKAKAKKLLDEKNGAVSIKFYKEEKARNTKTYYYQITNVSASDVNLTFEMAKTKALDEYAFKPRHLLNIQLTKPIIEVAANSKKLISFKYSNPFSARLKDIELELKFKKTDLSAQEFSVPLIIGDE